MPYSSGISKRWHLLATAGFDPCCSTKRRSKMRHDYRLQGAQGFKRALQRALQSTSVVLTPVPRLSNRMTRRSMLACQSSWPVHHSPLRKKKKGGGQYLDAYSRPVLQGPFKQKKQKKKKNCTRKHTSGLWFKGPSPIFKGRGWRRRTLPRGIEQACASRASQELPAGWCQVVTSQLLHINGHLAYRLGCVQQVWDAFPLG